MYRQDSDMDPLDSIEISSVSSGRSLGVIDQASENFGVMVGETNNEMLTMLGIIINNELNHNVDIEHYLMEIKRPLFSLIESVNKHKQLNQTATVVLYDSVNIIVAYITYCSNYGYSVEYITKTEKLLLKNADIISQNPSVLDRSITQFTKIVTTRIIGISVAGISGKYAIDFLKNFIKLVDVVGKLHEYSADYMLTEIGKKSNFYELYADTIYYILKRSRMKGLRKYLDIFFNIMGKNIEEKTIGLREYPKIEESGIVYDYIFKTSHTREVIRNTTETVEELLSSTMDFQDYLGMYLVGMLIFVSLIFMYLMMYNRYRMSGMRDLEMYR